jgi:TIR domain-containing protein
MFVSYSHENAAWCKRLLPVLRVKANVDTLQPWHDTELKAGDRWDKEIRAELERMDIFLCLVSYQFLASGYIQNVELPRASTPSDPVDAISRRRRRATRTAKLR